MTILESLLRMGPVITTVCWLELCGFMYDRMKLHPPRYRLWVQENQNKYAENRI